MNYCLFFQESRKIVIASWQYMVYNEFLPLLLGGRRMRKHGLKLKNKGYYYSRSSLLGLQPNICLMIFLILRHISTLKYFYIEMCCKNNGNMSKLSALISLFYDLQRYIRNKFIYLFISSSCKACVGMSFHHSLVSLKGLLQMTDDNK